MADKRERGSEPAEVNVAPRLETAPKQPICFVIMPISDVEPYAPGHFRRVYEFLIKPACKIAGMRPVRADDVNQTNHIVLDVLRHLVDAEMAICDLSARNANVFYELGVRQAFGKPVTLLKDSRTPRVFDIQGLRDVEYDDGLRVDTVHPAVATLAESLSKTLASHTAGDGQVNSLVQLLGLQAATLPQPREISSEGSLLLSAMDVLSSRMSSVEAALRPGNLGLVPSASEGRLTPWESSAGRTFRSVLEGEASPEPTFAPGIRVSHVRFGLGTVVGSVGDGRDEKTRVRFDDPNIGYKVLVTRQANLQPPKDGA